VNSTFWWNLKEELGSKGGRHETNGRKDATP